MYQQIPVFEVFTESFTVREKSSRQRILVGVHSGILNLVFSELFSCEHTPRGESDTKSIVQIDTCTDVFPGDRPDGQLMVNKV